MRKKSRANNPYFTLLISEGVTSLREAVLTGLGIGVLADWLIREDIASGRLVRVLPQWNAKELPVHVVYPGHRMLPVRVRAFVDFAVPTWRVKLLRSRRRACASLWFSCRECSDCLRKCAIDLQPSVLLHFSTSTGSGAWPEPCPGFKTLPFQLALVRITA